MRRYALHALAVTLAACGGSTSGLNTAEFQAVKSSAQAVSTAVTTEGALSAAMASLASCTPAETSFDARVRPMSRIFAGTKIEPCLRAIHLVTCA